MSPKPAAPTDEQGGTDLPADLQRELLDLEARGARVSHYELLGIDPRADRTAIRMAFVERSKRYHPDRHRTKRLGSFAQLLSDAFKKVTDAHVLLADADARAAYDAILSVNLDTVGKQAVQARADSRADEERRAQERRRRLFNTKGFARLGAARRLFEEALEHAEEGERGMAVEALKVARQLDPQRREIALKLVELEGEQRKSRTFGLVEQGKAAEAAEDHKAALKAYTAALQVDSGSGAATLGASRTSLALRDFNAASSWAARAVEYAPRAVEPRLILAKALIGLSQKAKAKATLQAVLELNPDLKEARALLKQV